MPWPARRPVSVGPIEVVTVVFALATLVLCFTMPPAFMQNDEGVKLIEAEALLQSGFRSRALPYPGAIVDESRQHFPLRPPFAFPNRGRWVGLYPLPFVALSAVAFRLGGLRGVFMVPWAAAVVSVLVAGRLARRATSSETWGALAAAALAVATPLGLYGTLHFEHTIGVLLVLGTLTLLSRAQPSWRALVGAGLLVGIGPAFRTELYCAPVAVVAFAVVLWGLRKETLGRLALVGAVAAAVAGLFWLWNLAALGTWDPVVTVNQLYNPRRETTRSLTLFFPKVAPLVGRRPPWQALVLAGAAGLVPLRGRALGWLKLVLGTLAVLWCGLLAAYCLPLGARGADRTILGLFATTPLALLGLVRGPWWRAGDAPEARIGPACAVGAAALVLVVVIFDLEAKAGGLQLGSRYLLPAAPLLLVAALDLAFHHRRAAGAAAIGLAILSIAATFQNARAEVRLRRENADLVAAVRQAGVPDVVTGFWWVPHVLAPLYLDHRIYGRPNEMLLRDLLRKDVRRVVRVHGGFVAHESPELVVAPMEIVLPPEQVVVYSLLPGGGS